MCSRSGVVVWAGVSGWCLMPLNFMVVVGKVIFAYCCLVENIHLTANFLPFQCQPRFSETKACRKPTTLRKSVGRSAEAAGGLCGFLAKGK